MKKIIVSGFPGIGKSVATKILRDQGHNVSDSDSSGFPKDNFPANYIESIKASEADIIFVSSHKEVRDALRDNDIHYILVYPCLSLKEEYLRRYEQRGSPESFLKLLNDNWENWITEIYNENHRPAFILRLPENTLMDVMEIVLGGLENKYESYN